MTRHVSRMAIFHSTTHIVAAHRAESDCEKNPTNVVVTIIFAYAGIEAFVSELVHMADTWQDEGEDQDKIIAFAEMAAELERNRANVVSLLQVLGLVFSGKPFTRGSGFLKDVMLLSRLRNALVHSKPYIVSFGGEEAGGGTKRIESILHQLSDRKLISDDKRDTSDWIDIVCTKEVAVWANDVTINLVQEISRLLPESGMLSFVEQVQVVLKGLDRPT